MGRGKNGLSFFVQAEILKYNQVDSHYILWASSLTLLAFVFSSEMSQ